MILCLVRRPLDCGGVSGAIQIGNLQFTIRHPSLAAVYVCARIYVKFVRFRKLPDSEYYEKFSYTHSDITDLTA